MDEHQPSLLREIVGSVAGAAIAAASSALVFLWFFDLPPEPEPRNHTGEALAMLILVMLVCGGFIGHRGFIADALSDLIRPVVGSYFCVIFLSFLANLDFTEIATMVGLASVGIVSSAVGSVVLLVWFPPKEVGEHCQQAARSNNAPLTSGRPWKW